MNPRPGAARNELDSVALVVSEVRREQIPHHRKGKGGVDEEDAVDLNGVHRPERRQKLLSDFHWGSVGNGKSRKVHHTIDGSVHRSAGGNGPLDGVKGALQVVVHDVSRNEIEGGTTLPVKSLHIKLFGRQVASECFCERIVAIIVVVAIIVANVVVECPDEGIDPCGSAKFQRLPKLGEGSVGVPVLGFQVLPDNPSHAAIAKVGNVATVTVAVAVGVAIGVGVGVAIRIRIGVAFALAVDAKIVVGGTRRGFHFLFGQTGENEIDFGAAAAASHDIGTSRSVLCGMDWTRCRQG
mmetsp:Transcript_6318/g.15658  ORF Transcript_6318/g.15658 Transcript_6318/m.15658 type:complete len:296 (+) Transcript_6318:582-1469(+)